MEGVPGAPITHLVAMVGFDGGGPIKVEFRKDTDEQVQTINKRKVMRLYLTSLCRLSSLQQANATLNETFAQTLRQEFLRFIKTKKNGPFHVYWILPIVEDGEDLPTHPCILIAMGKDQYLFMMISKAGAGWPDEVSLTTEEAKENVELLVPDADPLIGCILYCHCFFTSNKIDLTTPAATAKHKIKPQWLWTKAIGLLLKTLGFSAQDIES